MNEFNQRLVGLKALCCGLYAAARASMLACERFVICCEVGLYAACCGLNEAERASEGFMMAARA